MDPTSRPTAERLLRYPFFERMARLDDQVGSGMPRVQQCLRSTPNTPPRSRLVSEVRCASALRVCAWVLCGPGKPMRPLQRCGGLRRHTLHVRLWQAYVCAVSV